jgi:putative PIN family toxin of toxin-antitoxin system
MSPEILAEIDEVIHRPKFEGRSQTIETYLAGIREVAHFATPTLSINASRDPKDNKYLECAVAAKADYIVSGDVHLLELKEYEGIQILTASEYLKRVEG